MKQILIAMRTDQTRLALTGTGHGHGVQDIGATSAGNSGSNKVVKTSALGGG